MTFYLASSDDVEQQPGKIGEQAMEPIRRRDFCSGECRPLTCGKAMTLPILRGMTGCGSRQSLSSERWVRLR